MKRILFFIAVVGLFTIGMTASTALADKPPAPPGEDPCSHGRSDKPCRPDPQPEKGKDCEQHGSKNGGKSEDHCAPVTQPPGTAPVPPPSPPVVTISEPGSTVTVTITPNQPVTVSGPGTVVDKTKTTVTVKATKPGVIEVRQPKRTTRIGVIDRSQVGSSLAG